MRSDASQPELPEESARRLRVEREERSRRETIPALEAVTSTTYPEHVGDDGRARIGAGGYTAEQLVALLTPSTRRSSTSWRFVRSYEALERPGTTVVELVEDTKGRPLRVVATRSGPSLLAALHDLHSEMGRRSVAWSGHSRRSP